MTKQLSYDEANAIIKRISKYKEKNYARGHMIANARQEKNYSQETLASLVAVNEKTIRRIEGGGGCQLSLFLMICDALDINVCDCLKIGL